jgi:hypothetical protein
MTYFVTEIDAFTSEFLAESYPDATSRLYGYTELVRKKDQPMPVIINGTADRSVGGQISLNDQYDVITWVRLPGTIRTVTSEQDMWGLKEGRRQQVTLRWIIAHKVTLGENFIIDILQHVPGDFQIDGYQFVLVSPDINVDADHEAVYTTELGETVYEKHRFDWNIYAVELQLEYIVCASLNSP